jgi:hypothetical protein
MQNKTNTYWEPKHGSSRQKIALSRFLVISPDGLLDKKQKQKTYCSFLTNSQCIINFIKKGSKTRITRAPIAKTKTKYAIRMVMSTQLSSPALIVVTSAVLIQKSTLKFAAT